MNESGLSHIEDKAKNATWEDDFFGRKPYADKLTQLVKNTKNPYVIALSAEWGNGKTFFLNAWRNSILPEVQKEQQHNNSVRQDIKANCSDKFLLKENEIPCVYIDAWALEDLEDPLLAVCYEIQEQLNVYLPENDKKLLESALNFINFKNIIKIGGGVLSDLTKDKLKNTTKEITTILSDSISKHKKNDNAETNFFNSVKEIVNTIQEKTRINSILIMIDELDRCNPEYIIKLLERIKNLFNIPGLVFVLAVNDEMLYFAVKNKFNDNDILVKNYLDKFINLLIKLPEPDFLAYFSKRIINQFSLQDLASMVTDSEIEFWNTKFDELIYFDNDANDKSLLSEYKTYSIIYLYIITMLFEKIFISIRECEQFINKFYVICLSNKFTIFEMLLCLNYMLYGDNIFSIDFIASGYNNFFETWKNLLSYILNYEKLIHLGPLSKNESKEKILFSDIFGYSFTEEKVIGEFEKCEKYYKNVYLIVQQFIKEKGEQTKEEIEEKIRLAINFYEFTEKDKKENQNG